MLKIKIKQCCEQYTKLSMSHKVIVTSFTFWALQAIPKWGFVLLGDGETAANFMTIFITPVGG